MNDGAWQKSLPGVSPETKAFWDACRRNEYIVQRCEDCGKRQTYYRSFCCHCWSERVADDLASGKGIVWAFTVTHQNRTPGWQDEVPYVLAAVELEEGVKVLSNIINCDPHAVSIGMPVKVTFVKATDEITIPYFEPA